MVEVLALGAHASEIEREHRAHGVQQGLHVLADRKGDGGDNVEFAQGRVAFGLSGGQILAPDLVGAFGEEEERGPAFGLFGRELHVLRPHRGNQDRDPLANRVVDQLQRLASPVPPSCRGIW